MPPVGIEPRTPTASSLKDGDFLHLGQIKKCDSGSIPTLKFYLYTSHKNLPFLKKKESEKKQLNARKKEKKNILNNHLKHWLKKTTAKHFYSSFFLHIPEKTWAFE